MTPLLTPAQVAALLSVSRRTVTRMAESGELPGLRVGGLIRISQRAFNAWVVDREGGSADWERDSATSSRTEATSAPAADTVARRPVSLPVGGLPRDYAPVFPALWGETASNAASPAAGRARSTKAKRRPA